MRRLLCLLLLTAASLAQAQDADDTVDMGASVNVNGMGASVQMRVPETGGPKRQAAVKAPPARVVGADAFDVTAEDWKGQQNLSVLSPEGAECDVWNDQGELEGHFDLPFNFAARDGHYYRLIISQQGSVIYDRKVEAKAYKQTVVRMRGGVAPAPRAAAPSRGCDFSAVLGAVSAESFSDGKLDVIRTTECRFTIDQVGQLVDALDHSGDKVKVVEIVRPRISDPQNGFKLYAHFTFEGDKKAVKALLGK